MASKWNDAIKNGATAKPISSGGGERLPSLLFELTIDSQYVLRNLAFVGTDKFHTILRLRKDIEPIPEYTEEEEMLHEYGDEDYLTAEAMEKLAGGVSPTVQFQTAV